MNNLLTIAKRSVSLLSVVGLVTLGGCKVFAPYDSEFSCPGATSYGKCMSMQGAYSEALGGTVEAPEMDKDGKPKKKKDDKKAGDSTSPALSRYKEAEYTELAKLIEAPVTPMVKPAEVLRTLTIGYNTNDKTFYAPRFIFYFASEPGFVLGDDAESPLRGGAQTLYPNGVK